MGILAVEGEEEAGKDAVVPEKVEDCVHVRRRKSWIRRWRIIGGLRVSRMVLVPLVGIRTVQRLLRLR